MTVISTTKDPATLTMTMTAELDAPVARVWQLWTDPRQLERWWGPPSCPATVVDHDLTPGGRVTYFMSLPDGTTAKGWWRVLRVEPPDLLEFEDGFAHDDWSANDELPVTSGRVTFEERAGITRMLVETTFASAADMDRLVEMGMEEGMAAAIGQMDDLVRSGVRS